MKTEYLLYVFKKIWTRKTRSGLTLISILIGIAALFALISFGQGLSVYIDSMGEEMGADKIMVRAGSMTTVSDAFYITQDELDFLSKINGIKEMSAWYLKGAQIERDKEMIYAFTMGVSTQTEEQQLTHEIMTVKIDKGRDLKNGDLDKVVLGYNYQIPDKIFKDPVHLGEKLTVNNQKFEVVGFWDSVGNPQDDSNVYLTFEGFEMLFPEKKDQYFGGVMRAQKGEDPAAIAERAEEKLRKRRGQKEGEEDFSIQTFEQVIETFGAVLGVINGILVLIALISLIVAGVNIMNTMYTAVLERTKEIGVMKAIGARNSDILFIFVMESCILGFIGALMGVVLGYVLSSMGGQIAASTGYAMLQPIFPPLLIIGCLLFGTIVGAVAGFLPARSAAKQKPVDALRYE